MMMNRYTRIICTLGPASMDESIIAKMAKRGMDVVRINFSHGNRAQHQKMINLVRDVSKKYGYKINILQDLEGYRIRLGRFKKSIPLTKDGIIYLSNSDEAGDDVIPIDFADGIKTIKKGMDIFIDDGQIHLRVMGHAGKRVKLRVIQEGIVKERKGVIIPQLKFQSNIMTDKDKEDLEFGLNNRVEAVAQSFVRNKKDIQQVTDIVKPRLPHCKVIAKIESEEGVRNIDSMLDVCDGIMVARGDLGVSMPVYKIPMIQKYLIRHCNRRKKVSITATQMLESMVDKGRPTRAEVTDVANAILDGTDYVMLSGETAVGRYPSRTIMIMRQIIEYTERQVNLLPK